MTALAHGHHALAGDGEIEQQGVPASGSISAGLLAESLGSSWAQVTPGQRHTLQAPRSMRGNSPPHAHPPENILVAETKRAR
jgi:hypothetical protein